MCCSPGPDDEPHVFVGRTEGRIVQARGPTNFGWDPIFEPDGFDQTFAEMDKDVKNSISHRFRALNLLRSYLLGHATGVWADWQ
jgi:inosine triphosphate pyrophosphatase